MKKSLLLFALLLWVGVQTVMAQTLIKGRVLDGTTSAKEGVPGASVKVVGTSAGTQTNLDGDFEIEIPENSNGMLEITSVGLESQTVKAADGMVVTLTEGNNTITEVVITTPYGPPVTKEKFTGSADVITAKKIENTPVSDITKAIEGAAPGIQVTNGSGAPGSGASIQVRGRGSLSASTSPLIVLDGAPYDGDITSINPIDVANMTILKDAMATSLYGSRGSNGVILITTKRGKAGEKPRITIDGKMGTVTRGLPNYAVINDPKTYYEMAWRGQYNTLYYNGDSLNNRAGLAASGITSIRDAIVYQLGYNSFRVNGVGDSLQDSELLDPVTGKLNPNAQLKWQDDWVKEIERVGIRQDYNFNISGASDKSDYYLSVGYLNEQGYIINSDYSRFTTRLNVNTQANNWLRFGLNLSGSATKTNGTGTLTGSSANSGNPSFVALTMAPIYPVFYRDANNNKVIDPLTGEDKLDYGNAAPNGDPEYSMGTRKNLPGDNIVGQLRSNQITNNLKNVVVIPFLEAKLHKNVTFITRFNTSYTNQDILSYTNKTHGLSKGQGSLYKGTQNDFSYTWNQMVTYSKTFAEDHDLTVTGGHENYYKQIGFSDGSITGFPSDEFREFSVATGSPVVSSRTDNERMESYFAVANYAFKGRYLLQANLRRDGLSRFDSDVRWGNFGGGGLGWVIKEEAFLKDVNWINYWKLKVSYGTNGNKDIYRDNSTNQNYYASQGLYDLSRPNGSNSAAIPLSLPSGTLQWETQKAVNIGTEFTLFNNILSGEVNVFNRQTSDLYYNVPNPPSTGYISQIRNTGAMQNRGIELNFYVQPVKTKNFSWSFNTNFTSYKNKITKLAEGIDSVVTTSNTILKPGYDFTSFYLVQSVGVNPANGGELYNYVDTLTGEVKQTEKYNDLALLTGRKIVGNATPKFYGAITNTFNYKGFELSFLISYSVGGKYLDGTYQNLLGGFNTTVGNAFSADLVNSWTPENTSATLPRFSYSNADIANTSDRFLIDASYINIRNVNLRYTIPQQLIKKAGFTSLSAYISSDNIALFSKRQGMNPQGSFTGQVAYPYSPSRTIMFGLTVGL